MNETVNVIVPVYNAKRFLKECLDSIIGQTYSNLHILLVDDGSTDGSGAICDRYAEQDTRIEAIHQENQGAMKARIAGMEKIPYGGGIRYFVTAMILCRRMP